MQSLDILTIFTFTRSLIGGVEPEDQVDREPGMPAKHQVKYSAYPVESWRVQL